MLGSPGRKRGGMNNSPGRNWKVSVLFQALEIIF